MLLLKNHVDYAELIAWYNVLYCQKNKKLRNNGLSISKRLVFCKYKKITRLISAKWFLSENCINFNTGQSAWSPDNRTCTT